MRVNTSFFKWRKHLVAVDWVCVRYTDNSTYFVSFTQSTHKLPVSSEIRSPTYEQGLVRELVYKSIKCCLY